MRNLNDQHLTLLVSGWTLITAEDINTRDLIVGLATDPSGARGCVLAPQPTAGQ